MINDVEIRKATASDAEGLKSIRLLALKDAPDAYGSTYEESVKYSDRQWAQMASDWNYYLAYDGDRAIGMASGGQFPPFPNARWLYGMFVCAEFRGTAVATSLVQRVATWTRDQCVDTLGLHVTISMERAYGFYSKLGFVPTGPSHPMDRDPSLHLQTMTTDLRSNDRI